VAEAVGSALGAWKRQVDAAASGGPPVTYESLVDDYLARRTADQPARAVRSSLWQENIARSDKRTRALVTQQIRDNIELLATLIYDANEKNKRGAPITCNLTYARSSSHRRGARRVG